ncbi:MAG: hypothetical protein MI749_12310 [Desulfovibrionales bacterium]|nr:hypothetical protein [Desulfovibrionales bacterium]
MPIHYRSLLLTGILLLTLVNISLAAEIRAEDTHLSIGEKAQNYIQENNTEQARTLLKKGIALYPDSDWLHSIYGRLLFSEGDIAGAEDEFQQALNINKENTVAKLLIKEVRLTKNLLKDQEEERLFALMQDKGGDLLVIFLGVWMGTMLTSMLQWTASHVKRNKFEKALSAKDWDTVTDIIENQIVNWDKQALRKDMGTWLNKMNASAIEDIIKRYVDHQQHEEELLFFLKKFHEKR